MTKRFFATISVVLLGGAVLAGCNPSSMNEADTRQRAATDSMMAEADRAVGMPGITNWTERKQAKLLLEKRDDPNFRTFTYVKDLNGGLWKVCDSVGFGIPYSVQFTAPEKMVRSTNGAVTISQPDPNGLYMPSGLSATAALCVHPVTGEVAPFYMEPELIVSPWALKSVGNYMEVQEAEAATKAAAKKTDS